MPRGARSKAQYNVNYKMHLWNVYNDQEFYHDLSSIPEKLKQKYPYLETLKLKPLESKYYKPKLLDNPSFKVIASKYRVYVDDVIKFAKGEYATALSIKPEAIEVDTDSLGNYTVRFNQNITKRDFMGIWERVQSEKKPKGNTRDPELIYAIFKAREHRLVPLNFDEIVTLLTYKQLPFYKGTHGKNFTNIGWNRWMSLARLYKRNEPKIIE